MSSSPGPLVRHLVPFPALGTLNDHRGLLQGATFEAPPFEWIADRLGHARELLERQTERSALLLRQILGPVRLRPVNPQVGRPYYQAKTALQTIDLLVGPEGGSPGGQPEVLVASPQSSSP